MKAKDIIIGAVYQNTRHPGALYLGTGKDGKDKKIVIIRMSHKDAARDRNQIGNYTVNYSKNPEYWNAFVLTNKKLVVT